MNSTNSLNSRFLIIQDDSSSYISIGVYEESKLPSLVVVDQDWVWSKGFISNRIQIIKQIGLSKNADDNDILLQLYQQHGYNAVNHISGPFSWVIWDSTKKELVVTRDRLGVYCLYYSISGKKFLLSSNVELLLENLSKSQYNVKSIISHINCVPPVPGETYYSDIYVIEPGNILITKKGNRSFKRYWSAKLMPTLKLNDDHEYADAYRDLLFQVVSEYVPDDKFGITISSGLDSTSIAAAIRENFPQAQVTAFSRIAPDLPEADEGEYSSAVCKMLQLPFIPIRSDLCWPLSSDEGIKTTVVMPLYNIYTDVWRKTFQDVQDRNIKVLFLGLGGDRLFGGNIYSYPDLFLTGHWLELIRQIKYHLPRSPNNWSLGHIIRKMILAPIFNTYFPFPRRNRVPKFEWLSKEYNYNINSHNYGDCKQRLALPGRYLRLKSIQSTSLQWILEMMNIEAECSNIQLRYPLLDHRLIEFALSLPTTQTFRSNQRKIVVRNAMEGYLPNTIITMWDKIYPTKIGHRGLREREQNKIWNLITNMRATELGFINEEPLQRFYQDYLDRKHDNECFFHTLTLEDWLRRYF